MALVVEDGTGMSTAESYDSVSAADAYFAARANDAWCGSDTRKEQALREATEYIDMVWGGKILGKYGTKVADDQALALPLTGLAITTAIKRALYEYAVRSLKGPLMPDPNVNGQTTVEKVGPFRTETADKPQQNTRIRYPVPDRLMRAYCRQGVTERA